jgi:transcriptional regulator with XRE-family HTH domain
MLKKEANYLKRYRLMFGYSQRQIAKKLGIASTTIIGRWEQGLAYPDLQNLIKLSVIYKTLIDQLYPDLRSSIIKDLSLKDMKDLNDINPP